MTLSPGDNLVTSSGAGIVRSTLTIEAALPSNRNSKFNALASLRITSPKGASRATTLTPVEQSPGSTEISDANNGDTKKIDSTLNVADRFTMAKV